MSSRWSRLANRISWFAPLGVSYDDDLDRIILVADEIDRTEAEPEVEELFGLVDEVEPEDETGESVRLAMTHEQAAPRSPFAGQSSSRRADLLVRSADIRSIREATCARGRTATARR